MLDLLLHDADNSLLLDADDVSDNDLLSGKYLLQFLHLLNGLTLTNASLVLFVLLLLALLFLLQHALLPELEHGLFHFLFKLFNFVLTDSPDVVVGVL